jgi:glutathione S-transferase
MDAVRAARANMRHHMRYIDALAGLRRWLAGDQLTYADFAAAAHLSCADYLDDAPWSEHEAAKEWYQRIKSRPAFRSLLADRVPGMAPAPHYAEIDF